VRTCCKVHVKDCLTPEPARPRAGFLFPGFSSKAPAKKRKARATPAMPGVDELVSAVATLKALTDKLGKDNLVKLVGAL